MEGGGGNHSRSRRGNPWGRGGNPSGMESLGLEDGDGIVHHGRSRMMAWMDRWTWSMGGTSGARAYPAAVSSVIQCSTHTTGHLVKAGKPKSERMAYATFDTDSTQNLDSFVTRFFLQCSSGETTMVKLYHV